MIKNIKKIINYFTGGEIKMVIIVRNDIKMSIGKLSAQVGHGVLGSYKKSIKLKNNYNYKWELFGQKKVILQINSEEELLEKYKKSKELKIPCSLVRDAGRTEIKENTLTVLALGPYDSNIINKVTGSLKLLN